jgi:hypothetical protein
MTTPSQPVDSTQEFVVLAHALREASAGRDYIALAGLLVEYIEPSLVDVAVYIHTQDVGNLVFVGAFVQRSQPPGVLIREPSLEEMATVLQGAARMY